MSDKTKDSFGDLLGDSNSSYKAIFSVRIYKATAKDLFEFFHPEKDKVYGPGDFPMYYMHPENGLMDIGHLQFIDPKMEQEPKDYFLFDAKGQDDEYVAEEISQGGFLDFFEGIDIHKLTEDSRVNDISKAYLGKTIQFVIEFRYYSYDTPDGRETDTDVGVIGYLDSEMNFVKI